MCDGLKNVKMNKFVAATTTDAIATVSEFRTNFYIAMLQNEPCATNALRKSGLEFFVLSFVEVLL